MVSTPTLAADPSLPRPARDGPQRWRWSQHWRDLLFTHWRVPESRLRPFLPPGLVLDLRDGSAWVSAVAFRLERVRPRYFPAFGPVSNFLELNLRTYVSWRGEPAIFFLSIHANSRIAVTLARLCTPLPYRHARIAYAESAGDWEYQATRRVGRERRPIFRATFSPATPRAEVAAESLDAWLLERYGAFFAGKPGRLVRMVVRHPRWQVQEVRPEVSACDLGEPWGLDLGRPPDCAHFSTGVRALVAPFEEVWF